MSDDSAALETYYELSAYTLTHPDSTFIHQYAVDAFAAQRADSNTKPITLAFALIGLYLLCERGYSGRKVQHMHVLLARRRRQWPTFALPDQRGTISVFDVMDLPPGPERDEMIRKWCASVWQAYAASHDRVRDLLETELR